MPGSWYALWSKIKQGKRIKGEEVGSTILDSIVLNPFWEGDTFAETKIKWEIKENRYLEERRSGEREHSTNTNWAPTKSNAPLTAVLWTQFL